MDEVLAFLLPQEPSYPAQGLLRHVDKACDLIIQSIEKKHKIAVYGDYDTDGITSTAMLTLVLRKLSADTIPYIPNRILDGYGLNVNAIDSLHQQDVDLLITVDNGISSINEIAYAKSLGMAVILTDHHQPPAILPEADAIINPKLPDDPYPFKSLAGVGVAYKLVCSLADSFPELDPKDYLDLVALGTVADIVPLTGENRYLVKNGLLQFNHDRRQSLSSLLGASGLEGKNIISADISYQIAPRINASGRLSDSEDHRIPLELLLSSDPATCGKLAQILENHNRRRKEISAQMLDRLQAEIVSLDSLPPLLISLEPDNHLGVAGIAAGALTHKYYLPSIVGSIGEEFTTASCRSIDEFDIISALNQNKDLFVHYGGHKLAAGFTIENKKIPLLRERLLTQAEATLSSIDLQPTLYIDAVVTLADCDHSLNREFRKLEPTGEGNPTPLIVVKNVSAKNQSQVGKNNDHLKLLINDGTNVMPAIAFGMGDLKGNLPENFTLAGHFSENEFRGKKEFQFRIIDLESNV